MKYKLSALIILFTVTGFMLLSASSEVTAESPGEVPFTYTVFNFNTSEGWNLAAEGDKGGSSFVGRIWTLDFTKGAKSLSVIPTPVSMPGKVDKIHLKVRGSAMDHPVHIYIQTHFMTFDKVAGKLKGSGDYELVVNAPPGNGWSWSGGENDGEVHGPLRLLEIRIEGSGIKDECRLELISLSIEGRVSENRLCVMTSECGRNTDPMIFRAKVKSVSDKPLKGTLSWSVSNWDGNELEKGKRNVTIAPAAKENIFAVKMRNVNPRLKFAEAVFHLDIPGQNIPDADACWLAPDIIQGDTVPDPETSFGMGAYLGRYHGSELEQMARKAKESGVKWIREDFEWGAIETERGKYNWNFADSVVRIARENGISVCAIVAYWPSWAAKYTREGLDDYVIFLKELVNHYKNDIHYWEIWNEPNIFFWQGPRDMYARLLMKSYIAIKDADSTARVLGISTSGIDFDFIQKMLDLQAPFDVLTIHPYRSVLEENKFISELKRASVMATLPGGKRRPVWITEMGWTTYTPHSWWVQEGFLPTPLKVQAQLIARTYLSCIISGTDPKVFWYDLRNDGTDPLNFEDNIGIMYRDFSPKPAYIAYSTMTRTLKGMKFTGTLKMPDGVFSGLFEDRNGGKSKVIAVWSPDGYKSVDIEVTGEKVTIVNTIGEMNDMKVNSRNNRKFVTVELKKASPVYILM